MEIKEYVISLRKKRLSYSEIGELLGVSRQRIHQIITGYRSPFAGPIVNPLNIKILTVRKREALGLPTEKNPIKSGSRDFVRELVRMRDDRKCQHCYFQWQEGMRRLDVHYLDEEQEGKSLQKGATKWDREHMDRMITLCHRCHFGLDSVRKKIGKGARKSMRVIDKTSKNMLLTSNS